MFHSIRLQRIDFVSNPPLDPVPYVDRSINDYGDPVNLFLVKERDHKSSFAGSHFDPSRHSLRAMLNLGIQLQPVNYDITENDPNVLSKKAKSLSAQIENSMNSRMFDSDNSSENG